MSLFLAASSRELWQNGAKMNIESMQVECRDDNLTCFRFHCRPRCCLKTGLPALFESTVDSSTSLSVSGGFCCGTLLHFVSFRGAADVPRMVPWLVVPRGFENWMPIRSTDLHRPLDHDLKRRRSKDDNQKTTAYGRLPDGAVPKAISSSPPPSPGLPGQAD